MDYVTSISFRPHFDFTWRKGERPATQGKRVNSACQKGKGKAPFPQFGLDFHLATRPRARTNETKRFHGRSHPPNLRWISMVIHTCHEISMIPIGIHGNPWSDSQVIPKMPETYPEVTPKLSQGGVGWGGHSCSMIPTTSRINNDIPNRLQHWVHCVFLQLLQFCKHETSLRRNPIRLVVGGMTRGGRHDSILYSCNLMPTYPGAEYSLKNACFAS